MPKYLVTEKIVRIVEASDATAAINTRAEGVVVDYKVAATLQTEPGGETVATINAVCEALLPLVAGIREGLGVPNPETDS